MGKLIQVPRYDNFTPDEKASGILSRIKANNTKPELIFRRAIWQSGFRYRKNYKYLPGKPDLVFHSKKIVVFIDGDFWHGKNWEKKKLQIKKNREYWIPKIERNIQRDKHQSVELEKAGWSVIRFWESEIQKNLSKCLSLLIERLSI